MKNGFLLFLGLFAALGFSWAGIVLGSNLQMGALAPFYDDNEGQSFPQRPPGIAARGQLVYRDLNCASCHTQQVRRPDFGADEARGWGERQSVARDYIYQPWVQLGQARIGPDLTNLQSRKPTAPDTEDLMERLYAGEGAMPAYRFLFEERKIVGQVSSHALALTGALRPPEGREVIPTARAEALVAYLLSLNTVYDYPESRPAPPPATEGAKK
jgi:cytochrome c oxidase cbb3-type subunit 2